MAYILSVWYFCGFSDAKMLKRRIVWNLEVTEHLDAMLEDYIRLDSFKTKSEFIRGAVREKLEKESQKSTASTNVFGRKKIRQRGGENDRV
jgi:Arc/MetJ-type ribon-helix-helix transcriptional regulator